MLRKLELSQQENEFLVETLTNVVSESGHQIADTDSLDFGNGLKAKKEFAKDILERLQKTGKRKCLTR